MVQYGTVDSFLGRCARVWRCLSLLDVEYGAVDSYWGLCGRVWHC